MVTNHPYLKYAQALLISENNLSSIQEITADIIAIEIEKGLETFRMQPIKKFQGKEKVEYGFVKAEKGNVSWLGNLSFAVLSIKKSRLVFSKTGDIKILILRNGEFIDIDDKTKYNETSPYPIKIFSRTISGKLKKNDFILVFTRSVFDFLNKNRLLNKILELSSFSEEEIKKYRNKIKS